MVGYRSTTEHAIKILCCLYKVEEGELMQATELSERVGVTNSYVMRIVEPLKRAGLVDSIQGRNGGFLLAKPASEITLYEVMEVTEDTAVSLKRQGANSSVAGLNLRSLEHVFHQLNETVKAELSKISLMEIA